MTTTTTTESEHTTYGDAGPGGAAPDLAAITALMEVGERIGVLDAIATGSDFDAPGLARDSGLLESGVAAYLKALEAADLIVASPAGGPPYRAAADFAIRRHQAGYLSWALTANRPFLDHAREFFTAPDLARSRYHRDHDRVAVSAAWMDSFAAYPAVLSTILAVKPERIVDLGGGVCDLLLDALGQLPEAVGVGVDIDARATAAARDNARKAGLGDRLITVERTIQSLVDDPTPLERADVIYAGFVLHDLFPEEESTVDELMAVCRRALRPGGILVIAEIVPYLRDPRERRFSAIISFMHDLFMGRTLVAESTWTDKLARAGFTAIRTSPLGYPAGRLFIATH